MGAYGLFHCYFSLEQSPRRESNPHRPITAHRVEAYADTGAFILVKIKTLFMSFLEIHFCFLEFEPVTGVEPASSNYCLTD